MKKNIYEDKLRNLEDFKKELKNIIGKDTNLNRYDFEKYINLKYHVKFFNSLQEYYDKNNIKETVEDIKDYVDCLAFNIVETTYRVTEIKGSYFNNGKNGSAFVYYSYIDDQIIDLFVNEAGLKYGNFWGIFVANGEDKIRKNLDLYWR